MMSRPDLLAEFIDNLLEKSNYESGERFELVLAGDVVDLLSVENQSSNSWEALSIKSDEAIFKFNKILNSPMISKVVASLKNLLAHADCSMTVMVGNHDVELVFPGVQAIFLKLFGELAEKIRVFSDGKAYQIGGLLIEHGNRYDGANWNDWSGLWAAASAYSRFESFSKPIHASPGSEMVARVINHYKKDYPFIDLLQPCSERTLLLLAALEPGIALQFNSLKRAWWTNRAAESELDGRQPPHTEQISCYSTPTKDLFLSEAFNDFYRDLTQPHGVDEVSNVFGIALKSTYSGFHKELNNSKPINQKLKKELIAIINSLNSHSNQPPSADQYSKAAKRIIDVSSGAIDVVIMGHTHQARIVDISKDGKQRYINTGSWADVIIAPKWSQNVDDNSVKKFFRDLRDAHQTVRQCPENYAVVTIDERGKVKSSQLFGLQPETR
jgi:UDP-2,3-diacylglucosamine pyrophosphatase LpxH